jgi:hypothetical protein
MKDPLKGKYLAFVLSAASRAELLAAYPPKHSKVIGHHVTVQFDVTEAGSKMLEAGKADVVAMAYSCDDKVDCVMVSFNGTSKRLDGQRYHVTLSCSPTGKPVDSNALLKSTAGWADEAGKCKLDWSKPPLTLHGKLELLSK